MLRFRYETLRACSHWPSCQDRFKSAGKTYTADKWGGLLTRPSATSMFFDMEVCDCEWTEADSERARAGLWKT